MSDKKIDVRLTVDQIRQLMITLKTINLGHESKLYEHLEAYYVMNQEVPSMSIKEWNEKYGEDHEEK